MVIICVANNVSFAIYDLLFVLRIISLFLYQLITFITPTENIYYDCFTKDTSIL